MSWFTDFTTLINNLVHLPSLHTESINSDINWRWALNKTYKMSNGTQPDTYDIKQFYECEAPLCTNAEGVNFTIYIHLLIIFFLVICSMFLNNRMETWLKANSTLLILISWVMLLSRWYITQVGQTDQATKCWVITHYCRLGHMLSLVIQYLMIYVYQEDIIKSARKSGISTHPLVKFTRYLFPLLVFLLAFVYALFSWRKTTTFDTCGCSTGPIKNHDFTLVCYCVGDVEKVNCKQ